jgi:hypothetical protein
VAAEGFIMMIRVTFALAASLAIVGSAFAKDAQIGSAALTLPSPEGYCELNDKEPSDARALKEIGNLLAGAQNELLSMSADCSQLEAWRVAKVPALDDYVQYQTPTGTKESNVPRAASVKGFCANMRTEGDKVSAIIPDLNARVVTALKGAKFDETNFLGVLAEDADACYYGLLQKLRTEVGTEKTQVTVAATTVVKGKVVYYNLYTVYRDGADTLATALERHRRNVPALLAANGDLFDSGQVAKDDGSHQVGRPVPATEAAAKIPVTDAPAKAAEVKAPATQQVVDYSAGPGTDKVIGPDKVKGRDAGTPFSRHQGPHTWRNGHCLY